ncbi:hypothetical protein [Gymnodinialimonas ceratoperidinii]|uniref:Uncharacterized protein n=1 Tax=Gymnodinialimonas ceratoperidinii TaxID=2856823 RepID=A0A8F6U0A1_9RHOB|nr:hypothetical protein [Gymnodinialimonas ceratoperidinii]QXT40981.1 hypothetical protein KYE46_07090 [Gymnodinialimonas ceratoperidinii]
MSVFEELAALEKRKQVLLQKAKTDALARAEAAVTELNQLGFGYRLLAPGSETRATRKTGIREAVRALIAASPTGIARTAIMEAMNASDKRTQQSVANALAALKKAGLVESDRGTYKPVSQ